MKMVSLQEQCLNEGGIQYIK